MQPDSNAQTQGSPSVTHNDPGEDSEDQDFAGAAKPGSNNPDPNFSDGNTRDYLEADTPNNNFISDNNGGGTENDPGNNGPNYDDSRPHLQNHQRPETD